MTGRGTIIVLGGLIAFLLCARLVMGYALQLRMSGHAGGVFGKSNVGALNDLTAEATRSVAHDLARTTIYTDKFGYIGLAGVDANASDHPGPDKTRPITSYDKAVANCVAVLAGKSKEKSYDQASADFNELYEDGRRLNATLEVQMNASSPVFSSFKNKLQQRVAKLPEKYEFVSYESKLGTSMGRFTGEDANAPPVDPKNAGYSSARVGAVTLYYLENGGSLCQTDPRNFAPLAVMSASCATPNAVLLVCHYKDKDGKNIDCSSVSTLGLRAGP